MHITKFKMHIAIAIASKQIECIPFGKLIQPPLSTLHRQTARMRISLALAISLAPALVVPLGICLSKTLLRALRRGAVLVVFPSGRFALP